MTKYECFRKGRRCGIPGAGRKKSEKTILKEKEKYLEKIEKEKAYFMAFEKATEGDFNGFAMVEIFHEKINKENAILTAFADDCADVKAFNKIYHVNEDGIKCYFFSKNPTKRVIFNSSVYFF